MRFLVSNTPKMESPVNHIKGSFRKKTCYYLFVFVSHLKIPKQAWKAPVIKVVVKIKWRYSCGSVSGFATLDIVWPISSDAAAIVPTAMCLELPKTAYTRGGTKLESDTSQLTKHHIKKYISILTNSSVVIRKRKRKREPRIRWISSCSLCHVNDETMFKINEEAVHPDGYMIYMCVQL